MSQLDDMAQVIVETLKTDPRDQASFTVRLGVRMMETVGYDANDIIWALERVMAETTQFTAHRAIRDEIDRIRQEEAAANG